MRADAPNGVSATEDQAYYLAWFGRLAAEVGQVEWGALLGVRNDSVDAELARWPAALAGPLDSESMSLADEVISDREGRFAPLGSVTTATGSGEAWLLAYPVLEGREVVAVVLLRLVVASGAGLQRAMQLLQWSSAWISLRLRAVRPDPAGSGFALDLLSGLLERDRQELASVALVQALARRSGSGRVSFGSVSVGKGVADLKLSAISDVTEFDARMNEVRLIEDAMKEALLAGVPIAWHKGDSVEHVAWPAHDALLRGGGGPRIETYPLFASHEPVGAVCFESEATEEAPTGRQGQLQSALALSASILRLQQQAGRPAWRRLADATRAQAQAFLGPSAYRRKSAVCAILVLILFFTFKDGDYRLTGEAVIEPDFQRVLTVPYNGYLSEARVRPGDEVKSGAALVLLDDRDLRLERVRWLTERDKLLKKQQEAVAGYERASVNILSAQLEQAVAQLELVESQLARAEIKAPFDALVVSGDPSQRLGAVLQKGDTLYQIAPRDAYRVLVRIPEARIADISLGMKGSLQLNSVPGHPLELELSRIHPFTERREGASYFPVEAILRGDTSQLRPGMQGIASLEVGRRNLFGIWTRTLVEWVRLKWWAIAG